MTIPAIDLQRDAAHLAARLDDVAQTVGFFVLRGHAVPPTLLDETRRAALEFFDLPLTAKMTVAMPAAGYPYGYSPVAAEALQRSLGRVSAPDLKESFNVGPIGPPPRPLHEMLDRDERAVYAPNLWPAMMPALRPALERHYTAMAELADRLLGVCALALGLRSTWFERFVDRPGSALRLAHYPTLVAPVGSAALRAGAHTDYGTLTILLVDGRPGLQVEVDGTWVDVDAAAGDLVVNLGDLMARWTNDRWRSTMHRVVVADPTVRRVSIPFFHNANWDARIECITTDGEPPRYPPTTAGRHLMDKFRATVAGAPPG